MIVDLPVHGHDDAAVEGGLRLDAVGAVHDPQAPRGHRRVGRRRGDRIADVAPVLQPADQPRHDGGGVLRAYGDGDPAHAAHSSAARRRLCCDGARSGFPEG